MWMGGTQPAPLEPSSVVILEKAPTWPYRVVGYVQAQGSTLEKEVDVYRNLQSQAAKIGAPAVIVNKKFEEVNTTPTDESFLGPVIKGKAILPVKLSPAEQAKRSSPVAEKPLPQPSPLVETFGR